MSKANPTTPAADLGPATFTISVTAKGEVRKAMEAASRDELRVALVAGLLGDRVDEDDGQTADEPGQVWKRAIVSKGADGAEAEERYVLGVVMEPDTEDTHGERISADTILKAQRGFMQAYAKGYGRKGEKSGHMGRMHKSIIDGRVVLLETWIQREDIEINGEKILKGSWMQAVFVPDDDLWADVKKGVLTGFSIGGTAIRVQKD
jgi:DNA adenine methylase